MQIFNDWNFQYTQKSENITANILSPENLRGTISIIEFIEWEEW